MNLLGKNRIVLTKTISDPADFIKILKFRSTSPPTNLAHLFYAKMPLHLATLELMPNNAEKIALQVSVKFN